MYCSRRRTKHSILILAISVCAVVEEAELQEASKEGEDIATPDDIPLHADLSVTQVQLTLIYLEGVTPQFILMVAWG